MPASLPFSPAAERNAPAIEEVLREVLRQNETVLEIGAGTGQHAVHMATAFPNVLWLPTDVQENLASITARVEAARLPNLLRPEHLDVMSEEWPSAAPTVIYTANTFHIMPPKAWPRVIERAAQLLPNEGRLVVYGPFRYRGKELEASNLRFEQMLQAEVPHRGLRTQDDIVAHGEAHGLHLLRDIGMPANNRCLVFIKGPRPNDA